MLVVACAAPTESLEPAPLTSLPMAAMMGKGQLSAFWGGDDAYYVHASDVSGSAASEAPTDGLAAAGQWFRIDADAVADAGDLAERVEIARLLADIIPIGGGRVAFPVGSTGRRFYRIWRTGSATGSRTRILEVRAARSRRQPA